MGIFTVLPWWEVLVRVALVALAVYRLAHAFALESGPVAIFANFREWVLKKKTFDSWEAEFSRCPLCQSFWLSALAVLILFPWGGLGDFLMLWGGIAGIVMLIHLNLYRV